MSHCVGRGMARVPIPAAFWNLMEFVFIGHGIGSNPETISIFENR